MEVWDGLQEPVRGELLKVGGQGGVVLWANKKAKSQHGVYLMTGIQQTSVSNKYPKFMFKRNMVSNTWYKKNLNFDKFIKSHHLFWVSNLPLILKFLCHIHVFTNMYNECWGKNQKTWVSPISCRFSTWNSLASVWRWALKVYRAESGKAAGISTSRYSTGKGRANWVTSLPYVSLIYNNICKSFLPWNYERYYMLNKKKRWNFLGKFTFK